MQLQIEGKKINREKKTESFSAGFKFHKSASHLKVDEQHSDLKKNDILGMFGLTYENNYEQLEYQNKKTAIEKVIPKLDEKIETFEFRNYEQIEQGLMKNDSTLFERLDRDYKESQQKQFYYNYNDVIEDEKSEIQETKSASQPIKRKKAKSHQKDDPMYKTSFYDYLKEKTNESQTIYGGKFKNKQDFERYVQPYNQYSQQRIKKNKQKKVKDKSQTDFLIKASEQEKNMLLLVFQQLKSDQKNKVPKFEIVNFLQQNDQLLKIYNLDQDSLNQQILQFDSENRYYFKFEEFLSFLNKETQDVKEISNNTCLLSDDCLNQIMKIYLNYKQQDTKEIIYNMIHQAEFQKYLFMKAIENPTTEEIFTVSQILNRMTKQLQPDLYLTWSQFLNQFQNFQTDSKDFLNEQAIMKCFQDKQENLILEKDIIDLLMLDFKEMIEEDKYVIKQKNNQFFVDKDKLVENITQNWYWDQIKDKMARPEYNDLLAENIEQVLQRIHSTAFKYIDINEFLSFFTFQGLPEHYQEFQEEPEPEPELEFVNNENQDESQDPKQTLKNQYQRNNDLFSLLNKNFDLNSMNYKKYDFFNQGKNQKFTTPTPFQFLKDENKSRSIRQIRVLSMIEEKNNERQFSPFQAQKLPITNKPGLYKQIMFENEKRRQEIKKLSKSLTKKNEKPFNFYYRDMGKEKKQIQQEDFKFEIFANPVPETSKNNLFEEIQQQERQRKQDNEEREQMIRNKREEFYRRQQLKYDREHQHKVKQFHTQPVPNFEKLQQEFQQALEAKKQISLGTIIQPFRFAHPQKKEKQQPQPEKKKYVDPLEKFEKIKNKKPEIQTKYTKKYTDYVEQRKQEDEIKLKKEKEQQQQIQEKKQKIKEINKLVKGSDDLVDNTLQLKEKTKKMQETHKNNVKKLEQNYKEDLESIKERVMKRPLLFEQTYKRESKMEKIKHLVQYRNILKKNGIKNIQSMFKKDEWDLILDYEFLKNKGYKDFTNLIQTQNKKK